MKEERAIALLERMYIRNYGFSYSGLQKMPTRILRIWNEADKAEKENKEFERMKRKNARTNN